MMATNSKHDALAIQAAYFITSPFATLDHKSTNVPSMYITPQNHTPDKNF
jgi:hypothetical protein